MPAPVAAIIARSLAKSAADRFVDATALGEALAACAADHSWTPTREVVSSSVRGVIDESAPTLELGKP